MKEQKNWLRDLVSAWFSRIWKRFRRSKSQIESEKLYIPSYKELGIEFPEEKRTPLFKDREIEINSSLSLQGIATYWFPTRYKITIANNWLKMHGKPMRRNGGRRKKKPEGRKRNGKK